MSAAAPGLAAPGPPTSLQPTSVAVATAATLAAAALAVTSTGSMVLAALLVGVAARDRRSAGAALLAVVATAIRFRTATFDDLAGIQSVLGPAGTVGPATAAASAWLAAAAVILAARPLVRPSLQAATGRLDRLRDATPALACGLFAAALVVGPGPSDLGVRVLASVVGVALAAGVTFTDARTAFGRARPWAALVAGVAAAVLAGWPS
ncbi:MAG TPA: hypothetical protein VLR27_10855 [Acidimicrobiales bacterium]|nr:hypothetical protein [Acidimicrobiales bacterium]